MYKLVIGTSTATPELEGEMMRGSVSCGLSPVVYVLLLWLWAREAAQLFHLSFLFHLSSHHRTYLSFFITTSIIALISVLISAFTALSAHCSHSAPNAHCFHLIVALLNPILDHIPDHIPDHISDHILDPIFDHILDHIFDHILDHYF
ncbi:hypothetical protein FHG87_023534 [Trinorchestia longiramus]|nr:hypothetical protein FHG87_023534 [Trinorchestia longiramus]